MVEVEAQGRRPVLGGWQRNSASLPHWSKLAIATVVLFVVGGVLAPSSVHADAFLSMLPFMAILALASIGQHVVIQQRGFDLSVAGAISLAAVIVTVLPSPQASASADGWLRSARAHDRSGRRRRQWRHCRVAAGSPACRDHWRQCGADRVHARHFRRLSAHCAAASQRAHAGQAAYHPKHRAYRLGLRYPCRPGDGADERRAPIRGPRGQPARSCGVRRAGQPLPDHDFCLRRLLLRGKRRADGGLSPGAERDVGRPLYAADGGRGRRRRQRGSGSPRKHRGDCDRRDPSQPT